MIVLGLIFSAVFGFLIAKWMSKRETKKLDKKLNLPEEQERIIKLQLEQEVADKNKAKNYDERKRELIEVIKKEKEIPKQEDLPYIEPKDQNEINWEY